jgi:PAS domain S-box-containing protein
LKECKPSMTDHVNSEENPSVSEKKFSYIFQMTPDPIAISEMNTGKIIDINQAYIDWTGYSREEVIGKSALELRIWIHPEDRRKIFDALKKNGDINGTEVMMRLKSGQIRNVVFSARFLEMGQERYLLSLIHDISERKQMELALRESERRFRAISDYTPDWENWVGPDGKLLWVNPSVFKFIGYTVEECLQMDHYPIPLIDEADQARMQGNFLDAVRGSSGNNVECRVVCKNGCRKWIIVSWQPMYDENGKPMGHRASVRDISERKKLEELLRREKYFAESLIETAQVIVLVLDTCGRIVTFNRYMEKISGYRLEEVQEKEWFSTFLAEPYQKPVRDVFNNALKDIRTDGYVNPVVLKNGKIADIEWFSKALKDEQGQIMGVLSVGQDVTDRRRSEEAQKRAHDELEARVCERTEELAVESLRLQESNTALKVLLQHREEDQQEMEKKVLANIRKLVIPYVEKLRITSLTPVQMGYADVIFSNLQSIVSPFLRNLTATYMDFTPREIDVANLVREGKSAKEIALLLNCSVRSVEFHKDNIRRKLGLTRQKTNLRTYLLTLSKA